MKKIFFLFIIMTITLFSYSQITSGEWKEMMTNHQAKTDEILSKACPEGMNLVDYRKKVLLGEIDIDNSVKEDLQKVSAPLIEYGKFVAEKWKLSVDDEGDYAMYACIRPEINPNIEEPPTGANKDAAYRINSFDKPKFETIQLVDNTMVSRTNSAFMKLDWQEVAQCALEATRISMLWALGTSTTSTWTLAAITKTFKAAASKFLGPIGVMISVASFSYCLYQQYAD